MGEDITTCRTIPWDGGNWLTTITLVIKKNKLLAATLQISLENNSVMMLKTAEIITITLGFIVGRKIENSL